MFSAHGETSPCEAEYIKHDKYFAHRLAQHFTHEKRSAHESYQLSNQARVAVSSADRSCVRRVLNITHIQASNYQVT